MSDWIFAFFHLFLLIGAVLYAFYFLFQGNTLRFGIIIICLIGYYFLVLHKPVKREIERKRKNKTEK
ncbi:MAG: hypothetical protein E3J56_13725 [Candidatus Aminicenantes bacterium]|nr:MAG: hypothetical protein E3J56_13725 [Candidatus Aminicenantes bacterium]